MSMQEVKVRKSIPTIAPTPVIIIQDAVPDPSLQLFEEDTRMSADSLFTSPPPNK